MKDHSLYIVGIGASAGGLSAIQALVHKIKPVPQKVAYVIVQHLAPDKKSYMKEILNNKVQLPIETITPGSVVRHGIIYLCHLENSPLFLPIASFFRNYPKIIPRTKRSTFSCPQLPRSIGTA